EVAPKLHVDAEPSPSKGARPLALLVDPPGDVRLSLRPAGGFEEQRATLHEGARAVGGAVISTPRWEPAQLGDGSAAEAAAQLVGAVLAAQLEAHKTPDGAPWWKSPDSGPLVRTLWAGGRSQTASEAARALGLATLDPAALARLSAERLAYAAPEAPPPTP